MNKVLILNGPNLNMLGAREPEVYGFETLSEVESACAQKAKSLGFEIDFRQSSSEAQLVDWIHEAFTNKNPVVINPAALTHYSYSLRDACAMLHSVGLPLIEVHISNPHNREVFRHNSVISSVAKGVIAGFGTNSYLLALEALAHN
jgi:3-dehydroquinate dehydratase-2